MFIGLNCGRYGSELESADQSVSQITLTDEMSRLNSLLEQFKIEIVSLVVSRKLHVVPFNILIIKLKVAYSSHENL